MNITELRDALGFLFEPGANITLSMYMLIQTEGGIEERMADIDEEVQNELIQQFLNYINAKFIQNQGLSLEDISTGEDAANTVYYYDLDDEIIGLQPMENLLNNEDRDYFDFGAISLDSVIGYIFIIGDGTNKIAIYKKQYPISLIRQDSILSIAISDKRLVKVSQDILKVNESFEFLQIGEHTIVVNLGTFERNFGFQEIIKNHALRNLQIIENSGILESITPLGELAAEITFARKLMRVKADSQVLSLPFSKIKRFIETHPKLKNRMRFNGNGSKISLDTKTSKQLFLKLLDDDFLRSGLTANHYDAEKKNKLDEMEETD